MVKIDPTIRGERDQYMNVSSQNMTTENVKLSLIFNKFKTMRTVESTLHQGDATTALATFKEAWNENAHIIEAPREWGALWSIWKAICDCLTFGTQKRVQMSAGAHTSVQITNVLELIKPQDTPEAPSADTDLQVTSEDAEHIDTARNDDLTLVTKQSK